MLYNLSIVVPVKNEGENLKFILPQIKKFSDDIIVVDGHSNDGSKEICESLNIKFILQFSTCNKVLKNCFCFFILFKISNRFRVV